MDGVQLTVTVPIMFLSLCHFFGFCSMDTVFLSGVMGVALFGDVKTVPANGCSRAHEFYWEWQFTLDPSRQPHVNVPEVV